MVEYKKESHSAGSLFVLLILMNQLFEFRRCHVGTIQLFFSIVIPLMRTILITVAVLNVMWIWNDYLLPSLIINKPGWQTLPLKTYLFFGQFAKRWDLASAGLIMCIIPIIIFYLCCQKYIVKGITDRI